MVSENRSKHPLAAWWEAEEELVHARKLEQYIKYSWPQYRTPADLSKELPFIQPNGSGFVSDAKHVPGRLRRTFDRNGLELVYFEYLGEPPPPDDTDPLRFWHRIMYKHDDLGYLRRQIDIKIGFGGLPHVIDYHYRISPYGQRVLSHVTIQEYLRQSMTQLGNEFGELHVIDFSEFHGVPLGQPQRQQ